MFPLIYLVLLIVSATASSAEPSTFDITRSWSIHSPYKDAPGFGLPQGVPRGCELSQVHVLHRHAERYPRTVDYEGLGMEQFFEKIQHYMTTHNTDTVGTGPLSFLASWRYILGEEVLIPPGSATEATSGARFWAQYGRLLYRAPPGTTRWDQSLNVYPNGTERAKPIFRTTDMDRIVKSSRSWASGFFGDIHTNSSNSQYDLVVTPEGTGFNNTLATNPSCRGVSAGHKLKSIFTNRSLRNTHSRLAQFLPADFNLTISDVYTMLALCPMETEALGSSSFCSLFAAQEWRDFAYNSDMQMYASFGFDSPSGRAQGIGYVLELAARLSGHLIHTSDTSINATVTGDPATFPLYQPLYLDMSHDDLIITVLTALGLTHFKAPTGLPAEVDHAVPRTFRLEQITPYGAHLATEVWKCPSTTTFDALDEAMYENPDLSGLHDATAYIRFMLNGAPVPLEGNDGCSMATTGFCRLEDFLRGVPALKEKATFQQAVTMPQSVILPSGEHGAGGDHFCGLLVPSRRQLIQLTYHNHGWRAEMQREEAIREQARKEEIFRRQRAMIDGALEHPVTRERILKRVRIYKEFQANKQPVSRIRAVIRPISLHNRPLMAPRFPVPLRLERYQRRQIRGIFEHYDIYLDGKAVWMRPVEMRSRSLTWGFATEVVQPVLLRAQRPVHRETWRRAVALAGRVITKESITEAQITRVAVASQDKRSGVHTEWVDPDSWVTECVVYIGKPFD
ncbi:histidine phosphatase superfamily [Aspergillus floccosus]